MSKEYRTEFVFDEWGDDAVARAVGSAARIVYRRFPQWVEKEDLVQEGWTWLLTHPGKLAEYERQGETGRKKLVRTLINACTAYSQREKAERSGYRAGDNHYYGTAWLRGVLPVVLEKGLDPNSTAYADWPIDTPSGQHDRAEWLDVIQAVGRLTDSEYEILWRAFHGDPEEEQGYFNVAEFLNLNYDNARQRVMRIIRKMQTYLGGPDPRPVRKSKSNAQSLYETRNQYDGDEN